MLRLLSMSRAWMTLLHSIRCVAVTDTVCAVLLHIHCCSLIIYAHLSTALSHIDSLVLLWLACM